SKERETRLAVLTQAIRQLITSEPTPTQGNRLKPLDEEFSKSIKPSTTAALEVELEDILIARIAADEANDWLAKEYLQHEEDRLTALLDKDCHVSSKAKRMNAETPADRITGLHAVMKMLLQSPSLERPVDACYVQRVCKGIKPTTAECTTVATLVNLLRPFVPKRRLPRSSKDMKTGERVGGYTYKAEAHMALRAPFLVLANEFFRVAGYPGSMRKLTPQISPSSRHALALTRSSLSEILYSSKGNQFDYYDNDHNV
ncbi:hypothetical protein BGX30_008230, partial [Mortierella sp. GBA39]